MGKYVTISDDEEAEGYRNISAIMTKAGHKMNHSSARNYVLRAMKKFAYAIAKQEGVRLSDERAWEIAKNPTFQKTIGELFEQEVLRY